MNPNDSMVLNALSRSEYLTLQKIQEATNFPRQATIKASLSRLEKLGRVDKKLEGPGQGNYRYIRKD
jgi:predicted transcriptional regulator